MKTTVPNTLILVNSMLAVVDSEGCVYTMTTNYNDAKSSMDLYNTCYATDDYKFEIIELGLDVDVRLRGAEVLEEEKDQAFRLSRRCGKGVAVEVVMKRDKKGNAVKSARFWCSSLSIECGRREVVETGYGEVVELHHSSKKAVWWMVGTPEDKHTVDIKYLEDY